MTSVVPQPISGFQQYKAPLPGLGQTLSQGAITAIFAYYCALFYQIIFQPNGYDFFLAVVMPVIFGYAAIFGMVVAFAIWSVMKLVRRPLRWWMRIATATLVIGFVYRILNLSLTWDAGSKYVKFGKFEMFFVLALGLVTGSRLQPGRALISGLKPLKDHSWPAAVVGFLFRTLTLFGWMEAEFEAVFGLTRNYEVRELTVVLLILTYFVINTWFAFAKRDSRVLLTIAVLVNSAWILVLVKYWNDLGYACYLIIAYLSLWFAFMLTHWSDGNPLFSCIKKELRYYYLIN